MSNSSQARRTIGWIVTLAVTLAIAPAASATTITEFPHMRSAEGIAMGPDGNLWVSAEVGFITRLNPRGVVTGTFPLGDIDATAYAITAGPDGAMWFIQGRQVIGGGPVIGRVTMSGVVTHHSIPGLNPRGGDIAAGPDGNVWFTEPNTAEVARITPSGAITEFPVGTDPRGITTGPDGNLWFAEQSAHKIGRMTPGGLLTEFSLPGEAPADVAVGRDRHIWYTVPTLNRIGRISLSGFVARGFTDNLLGAQPTAITAASDGNLWFGDIGVNRISRITPSGRITPYTQGIEQYGYILDLAAGPNGTVWFVNFDDAVGRATLDSPVVSTGVAGQVSPTRARLTGVANPNSSALNLRFEFGTTTAYGRSTSQQFVEDTDDGRLISADVDGLAPNTTYHYRLAGSGPLGSFAGGDVTFTTPPPPPVDADGDGYASTIDCDDHRREIHPGAPDVPGNGVDEDCAGGAQPFATLASKPGAEWAYRPFRFTKLYVRNASAGSSIEVRCRGGGCGFAKKTTHVRRTKRLVSVLGSLRSARLRRGTTIEIRVTHPGFDGVIRRYTVRGAAKAPAVADFCLAAPGGHARKC